MKMEFPNQQNSVHSSKDMIIKIHNILFHSLERNQAEENESMLNNVIDLLRDRKQVMSKTRKRKKEVVQAVIHKNMSFQ